MTEANNRNDSLRPGGISRREFLKVATVTGLLAGCSSIEQPANTPTGEPTTAPLPTDTPTPAPTATSTPIVDVRRPEIIKMYPDAPSKVVHTHHPGVWDGEELSVEVIRQMLDASITKLTGLNDAIEAWAALFAPDERIAIKANTISHSRFWTHPSLVMTVTECLQRAGVPAEQIVIFDRYTTELEYAGYPINEDQPGVRCYSSNRKHTAGWTAVDTDLELSDILLGSHALINIPILKQHSLSGITFAMKNHYGTISNPASFHANIGRAISELNALPPIKDRTRLIIGDALKVAKAGWTSAFDGDSIFMSFDPVAHDTAGLQLYSQLLNSAGRNPKLVEHKANSWLENATALGLGTNAPDNMELVEVAMG